MLSQLIKHIHDPSKRLYVNSGLFNKSKSIKICLLDFINAPDYFITENGLVWNRKIFNYARGNDTIFKEYLPMVVLDKYYQVPWVFLKTESEAMWYPVDLLVGWAFHPTEDVNVRYFKHPNIGKTYIIDSTNIDNSDKLDLPDDSLYKQFIDKIYA